MPAVPVTTWHLEMRDRAQLRAVAKPDPQLTLTRAEIPSPALNRFLYTSVGGAWHWHDRLSWTWAQWMSWLDSDYVETWVLALRGTPTGYFELHKQTRDEVEIAYFGIAPQFLGRRFGGYLLSVALERAWETGARRVWVHTCSLDHAGALANYTARGMTVFKEETVNKEVPANPAGPWPGAEFPSGPQ